MERQRAATTTAIRATRSRLAKAGVVAVSLALLAGCASSGIGPRTIAPSRFDYSEAISRSWDEQLLLNLVRLRYLNSPLFVDVSSITASYSLGRSANAGGVFRAGGNDEGSGGFGIDFRDSPVISYNYLQGEEFAKHILTPLSPTVLEPLTRSGWSMEWLMLCCIQAVNGIAFDPADPTPFRRVARLFEELQRGGRAGATRDADGRIYIDWRGSDPAVLAELRSRLGLDPTIDIYEVTESLRPTPQQISLRGRALLSVMYLLSAAVEVPQVDRDANRVLVDRDPEGREISVERPATKLLRIRSGDSEPTNAAVKVYTRGHWFWIADDDAQSKGSLALLRLLLSLKSGERTSLAPVVTIPAR